MHQTIARFGHTAEVYEKEMYLFGGFEGVMLADLYKYSPGKLRFSLLQEGNLHHKWY